MSGAPSSGPLTVLHSADLHLGRSFASWGDAGQARQQDLLDTLDQIGSLAREHEVHLVVLAGDQFDRHNPEPALASRFLAWLDRLNQAGIQVAMISGNHDSYWYEDSVYRQSLPPNTILFREPSCGEPVMLEIAGHSVWLYGIAHDHTRHRDVLPGFRRRGDGDIHIGLMHATVDPRPDFDVADRYLPLQRVDLATTELDYIALGHIHGSRTINDGQPGMAAYPGSPEPLDTTETGERSVLLLRFTGGPPSLSRLPCGRRTARRQSLDCTGLGGDEIANRITDFADDNAILTVELTGAPQEIPATEDLETRHAHHFCYLSLVDRTSVVDAGYVRQIENERTIRGQFVRELRDLISNAQSDEERETAELALQLGLIQLQKRSAE